MRRVSAREAHELMEREGFVYLDVRSVPEFEAGHPRGAYNLPLREPVADGMRDNPDFLRQVAAHFARDQKLVIGCQSGVRSLRAAELLLAEGYSGVLEQRAGMDGVRDAFGRVREPGWRAEGLPVALSAEPGRSYAELK
jgi:rhodanese-related sulfurtransferase